MLAYLKSLLPCSPLRYFQKKPLLALDLGFNELRLLQLTRRGGTYHIEKNTDTGFARGAFASGQKTILGRDWRSAA